MQDKGRLGHGISVAGMCVLMMTWCACERAPASQAGEESGVVHRGRVLEHAAQRALETHLDAYVYGDVSGAFATHVASTSQNTWCGARSFVNLLEELHRSKDDASCAQATVITSDEEAAAQLSDEELLMMQTMRFVCEHSAATCRDYSESVYRSALGQTSYWSSRLERYEVQTMQEQEDGMVKAYIDLHFPAPVGVRRELVMLRQVEGAWVVAQGLDAW